MLKEFIDVWEDLQRNFQYYFRSIDGVGDLLKAAPMRGRRVSQDLRLTFNMAEGIDQRISYLLNLYRKIAWDDTYQRWVLPDMMRYFGLKIYITEFRTFHRSSISIQEGKSTETERQNIVNYPETTNAAASGIASAFQERIIDQQLRSTFTQGNGASRVGEQEPIYLQILNGILPTHVIECQMCEFDIENFNIDYRDSLSVADDPTEATLSFQVKIGNVNEIQTYPLFNHYIFNDFKINGIDRSRERGNTKNIFGQVTSTGGEEIYTTTKQGDRRYANLDETAQDTFPQVAVHRPGGNPFIEQGNKELNLKNSGPNAAINTNNVNSTDPATWVGNALKFGEAFAVNFITEKVDKAKMTNIPGLGFSFNDAVAAIESKSFVSVLALIRRAIQESVGGTEPPSALLDEKIDNTFREFLTGVSNSEATDGDELELREMAIKVLSDRGKWEEIKDLSYATDLVGPGEKEIGVSIEGGNQYKSQVNLATNNDRSLATDLDGEPRLENAGSLIGDSTPSSATSVNQSELQGKDYAQPQDRSLATDLDGDVRFVQPGEIITAQPSSATTGRSIESERSCG
jgi:hypothetical protein